MTQFLYSALNFVFVFVFFVRLIKGLDVVLKLNKKAIVMLPTFTLQFIAKSVNNPFFGIDFTKRFKKINLLKS